MHFGKKNPHFTYLMNRMELECTQAEKDLGILFTDDFKVTAQWMHDFKKANRVLGMIIRVLISFKGKAVLVIHYKSLPGHIWNIAIRLGRHIMKKTSQLEKVQHRLH